MADLAEIRSRLERTGQTHLLAFWDELTGPQQETLLEQLAGICFDQLADLTERYVTNTPTPQTATDAEIIPPRIFPHKPADDEQAALYARAKDRGNELLRQGKVAAFVVAGGQGTRLGFDGPKGCFPATPVARKPLFQVFAERIHAASVRAAAPIPWYVMTSPINDGHTRAFFRRNHHFGLDPDNVRFLLQGTMPAIDLDGKLLLAGKGIVAVSPNGHGGAPAAMRDSGALDEMAERGIEAISYFQVDNPLVKCIDPLFLGLHDLHNAEMSAKALPKRDPMEPVGNFCLVNGKTTVIEYTDMPEELARATTEQGFLRFSAGSIAIHVLSRSFVERITADGKPTLPYHPAAKKVRHVDADGQTVTPKTPNAVKLEMFVFDAMALANETLVLETDRAEEFSPIKNAEGPDSLVTSLHDQVRRAANWLDQAGIELPLDADGQVAAAIEISPLFADSAEEVAARINADLTIAGGQQLYLGSRGQLGGTK